MYVAPAIQPPHAHPQNPTATVVVMATVAPDLPASLKQPASADHFVDHYKKVGGVTLDHLRVVPNMIGASTAAAVAGFERWAADRLGVAGGISTTDTPPGDSDLGDEHRPEWSDAYQPTRRQEVEDLGQRIGLEGGWPSFEETFPEATPRESLLFALEFSEGLHMGHRLRARRIGYEVGVDGGPGDLPVTVPGRFSLDFLVGWDAGSIERAERARIMADHFARLDFEAAEDERERDLMALAREAGGWDRVAGRALI